MSYNNLENGQKAGLIITGYNIAVIGVTKEMNSNKEHVFIKTSKSIERSIAALRNEHEHVYLRALINRRRLNFSYSLDNKTFHKIKINYSLEARGFNGLFLGLFSMQNNSKKKGYADFGWFSYKYDGPKSMELSKVE